MKGKVRQMKALLKSIVYILAAWILGLLLLAGSCMIPVSRMEENCRESVPVMEDEGEAPTDWYSLRVIDHVSDTLMLETAAYSGNEPVLERAVADYRLGLSASEPVRSFSAIYGAAAEEPLERVPYARYWHGYLIVLRPMLCLFNYTQIRNINTAVQYVLLVAVLRRLFKKCRICLFPFAITVLFLAPTAIGKTLHYSSDYYIVLLAVLFLLWNPGGMINRENVWKLFLFSGIATAFLDLLSAPTITMTIPLCVFCAQLFGQGARRDNLRTVLLCAFVWFVGYAGMWAGKWLIALAIRGKDFWADLSASLTMRSASDQYGAGGFHVASRFNSVKKVLASLFSNMHLICITGAYTALCCLALFGKRKSAVCPDPAGAGLFLVPVPVIVFWILVMSNHSIGHYWFSYRTAAPAVFAVLSALSALDPDPA